MTWIRTGCTIISRACPGDSHDVNGCITMVQPLAAAAHSMEDAYSLLCADLRRGCEVYSVVLCHCVPLQVGSSSSTWHAGLVCSSSTAGMVCSSSTAGLVCSSSTAGLLVEAVVRCVREEGPGQACCFRARWYPHCAVTACGAAAGIEQHIAACRTRLVLDGTREPQWYMHQPCH